MLKLRLFQLRRCICMYIQHMTDRPLHKLWDDEFLNCRLILLSILAPGMHRSFEGLKDPISLAGALDGRLLGKIL